MNNNANIFYVTPDNGLYPYVSANFEDHDTNQMDRMYL